MPADIGLSRWYKVQPILVKLLGSVEARNRKVILKLLEPNQSAVYLDCGCGDGAFTSEMGKRIGTDKLFGIDIMEELAQLCKAKGISVYLSNLNKAFPMESQTFDVVTANQILEHVNDSDGFIQEIHRVLKPGGYAIISTPNLASLPNLFSLILGWQPLDAWASDIGAFGNPINKGLRKSRYPGHKRVFTYSALKDVLKYHGFAIEKAVGVGYYPIPMALSSPASRLDPWHTDIVTIKARKR